MKKNLIFWLFAIGFATLLLVQGFYIYNTSKLWKAEIYREVSKILGKIEESDEFGPFKNDDDGTELIAKYDNGKISKEDLIKKFQKNRSILSAKLSKIIDKKFANSGYDVAMMSQYNSVFSVTKNKMIFDEPVIIFATKGITNGKNLSTGKWLTSQHNINTEKPETNFENTYRLFSENKYEVLNINSLVFWKIFPLILVNLAIISLLLFVFWKTLQNLTLQQKKISELHTTIDSIAHELNTPITTMKFSVADLQNPDLKQVLERQISRIENISNQISQKSISDELLTENDVEGYFENIKTAYPETKFEIRNKFEFNDAISKEDFELIFNNLIGNSVKYKSTKIFIETVFDTEIILKISDNGIGIPENERNKIFEKYYRVSRPENMQINGLGLGLYLVNEIVKKYNGKILVQNPSEKGVVFSIKIPQNQ